MFYILSKSFPHLLLYYLPIFFLRNNYLLLYKQFELCDYYEELYFVYELNKKYNSNYYYSNGVKECKVVSKTFYRTKKEIK